MPLPELSAVLTAKTDGFEAALNRSAKATEDASSRIRGSTDKINASFNFLKGAAAGLASVLTVRAFFGLIKGSIDSADHLNDLSKKTGIAVETLGGLGFAASQSGGDLESVSAAAGKLNKSIAEAAAGNKGASDAFNALGISVKDSSGNIKKADVVLAEVADGFARFEDGPNKAALALKLFGKSGADIIPLLNEGGASLRANTRYYNEHSKVTQELAQRADEFNDLLGKLKVQTQALGTSVAIDLLPLLTRLVTAFNDLRNPGTSFGQGLHSFAISGLSTNEIQQRIDEELQGLTELRRKQKDFDDQTKNGGDFFGNFFVHDESGRIDLAKKTLAQYQGIIADRNRIAKEAIYGPGGVAAGGKASSAPGLPGTGGANAGSAKAKPDDSGQRAADALLKTYQSLLDKTNELTTSEILQRDIRDGSFKGASAGSIKLLEHQARLIDLSKAFADSLKDVGAEADRVLKDTGYMAYLDGINEQLARAQAIVAQTPLGRAAMQREDIAALDEALRNHKITVEEYGQALEVLRDKSEETADEMTVFFEQAARNMQDSMASGFFDIMQGNFDDLGTTFKRTIDKMVADVLAAKAATALFGDFGKGGNANLGGLVGDAASWFSKMSFADGGIMTSGGAIPLNRYAGGGIANRPQLALYGEGSMNEAIIPLPDGRNVPVKMQGGGASTSNVYNINVTAAPGATRETATQAADAVMRRLQSGARNR